VYAEQETNIKQRTSKALLVLCLQAAKRKGQENNAVACSQVALLRWKVTN
jgi:hypothetical protein